MLQDSKKIPQLNEKQAAALFGLSIKTLQAWRYYGKGPSYHKIGGAVRYALADLESYFHSRKVEPRS